MSVLHVVAEQDVKTAAWVLLDADSREWLTEVRHRHQVEAAAERNSRGRPVSITYRPASKRRGVKRARES